MRGDTDKVSDVDLLIAREVGEHTRQIEDIQNCIIADESRVHRELLFLSTSLARLEERLGITWSVVVPED